MMCEVKHCRSDAGGGQRLRCPYLKGVTPAADNAERERDRGVATFYEVKADAVALLRAMQEDHERHDPGTPFSEGTRLAPYLAAERAGLDPGTLRYERAVRYLVREGALVWEERVGTVPGIDFYRFTGNGLELLREA
jgi:hypothetical protein